MGTVIRFMRGTTTIIIKRVNNCRARLFSNSFRYPYDHIHGYDVIFMSCKKLVLIRHFHSNVENMNERVVVKTR